MREGEQEREGWKEGRKEEPEGAWVWTDTGSGGKDVLSAGLQSARKSLPKRLALHLTHGKIINKKGHNSLPNNLLIPDENGGQDKTAARPREHVIASTKSRFVTGNGNCKIIIPLIISERDKIKQDDN